MLKQKGNLPVNFHNINYLLVVVVHLFYQFVIIYRKVGVCVCVYYIPVYIHTYIYTQCNLNLIPDTQ